jgi:hypothetical protein
MDKIEEICSYTVHIILMCDTCGLEYFTGFELFSLQIKRLLYLNSSNFDTKTHIGRDYLFSISLHVHHFKNVFQRK